MLQSRNLYLKTSAPQSKQSQSFSQEKSSNRLERCKENGSRREKSRPISRHHHLRPTKLARRKTSKRSAAPCDQIISARPGAVTGPRVRAVVWGYSSSGMPNRGVELRGSQQERGKDFSSRGLRREMGVLWKGGKVEIVIDWIAGALDCWKKEIGVFSIMIPMVLFSVSYNERGAIWG